jgi:hypothetical protein
MLSFRAFLEKEKQASEPEPLEEVIFPSISASFATNAVQRFQTLKNDLKKSRVDQAQVLGDMLSISFAMSLLAVAQSTNNQSLVASARRFI